MTNKEIEELRKIAIDVADACNRRGVCGIRPEYDKEKNKEVAAVHITYEEFCKTFDKSKREPYLKNYDEVFVTIDGVKFFSLVEKEVK